MQRSCAAALLLLTAALAGCTLPTTTPDPAPTPGPPTEADAVPTPGPLPEPAQPARPNILLILTDDQRFDSIEFMPLTKARIFDAGIAFENAFATTSQCCPSRSSILTGEYAHDHGVLNNSGVLEGRTFPMDLHESGYYTAMIGKYLNSWDGTGRPEFDYWDVFPGGQQPYRNALLYHDNRTTRAPGYITDVLRDSAIDFLQEANATEKPFLLIFSPNAPHFPTTPATEDEELYADLPPARPPSYDVPGIVMRDPINETAATDIDDFRLRQLRTLASLDRAVAAILDQIDRQGLTNSTAVVYMSDNGMMYGEHRLTGKNWPYEESVRIPMAIRYPPLTRTPRVDAHLVANIDVAPTFYDLAQVDPTRRPDGRSLLPILSNESAPWRTELLLENWNVAPFANYTAVRTPTWKLVAWWELPPAPGNETSAENDTDATGPTWDDTMPETGSEITGTNVTEGREVIELFDLTADPYELNDLSKDEANAALIRDLLQRRDEMRAPSDE